VAAVTLKNPDWFRDKLLLWMKTIIQSFDYPDRDSSKVRSLMFKDRKLESEITKRPAQAKSIYHTYYLLDQKMSKELSKEHYELFRSYLQQATDVLSDDYGP